MNKNCFRVALGFPFEPLHQMDEAWSILFPVTMLECRWRVSMVAWPQMFTAALLGCWHFLTQELLNISHKLPQSHEYVTLNSKPKDSRAFDDVVVIATIAPSNTFPQKQGMYLATYQEPPLGVFVGNLCVHKTQEAG